MTRPVSHTLLDHAVFVCSEDIVIQNATIHQNMSDHNVVISHIPLPGTGTDVKHKVVTKSHTDYAKVNERLRHSFDPVVKPPTSNVNSLYDYFVTSLKSSISEFTTTETKRVKLKHLQCPYMNDHLEYLIRRINNLKNKIKSKRKRNLDYSHLDRKLQVFNVSLERFQTQYKSNYYEDLFNNSSDSKHAWRNINTVLGKSKDKGRTILIKDKNVSINKDRVADHFNDFFFENW